MESRRYTIDEVTVSICDYDDQNCSIGEVCEEQETGCLESDSNSTYLSSKYVVVNEDGEFEIYVYYYNDTNCTSIDPNDFPSYISCNQCTDANSTVKCEFPPEPEKFETLSASTANAVAATLMAVFFVSGLGLVYYMRRRGGTSSGRSGGIAATELGSGSTPLLVETKSLPSGANSSANTNANNGRDKLVVFVLGGPGAGKGTQCANIVRDYGMLHLSSGDLLRKEVEDRTERGKQIDEYMKDGKLVPGEWVIELLHNAIMKGGGSEYPGGFLIDGYPREVQQAIDFESKICPGRVVLFFECGEEAMLQRLLKRGQTSGRVDDNHDAIKKRFHVFRSHSIPVIEHFEKLDKNKVAKIDAERSPEEVYRDVQQAFQKHNIRPLKG